MFLVEFPQLVVVQFHDSVTMKPCCHGHPYIVKVENILLKEDGDYVLCDYGSCSLDTLNPEVNIYHIMFIVVICVCGCNCR